MLLLIVNNQVLAQPLPPTGTHGNANDQPAGAPLDGGLSVLLVLGVVYGSKKAYRLKKVKEEALGI